MRTTFKVGDKVATSDIVPIENTFYFKSVQVIGEVQAVYDRGIAVKIGNTVLMKKRSELRLVKDTDIIVHESPVPTN